MTPRRLLIKLVKPQGPIQLPWTTPEGMATRAQTGTAIEKRTTSGLISNKKSASARPICH